MRPRGVRDILIAVVDGLTGFPGRSRRPSHGPGSRPASLIRRAIHEFRQRQPPQGRRQGAPCRRRRSRRQSSTGRVRGQRPGASALRPSRQAGGGHRAKRSGSSSPRPSRNGRSTPPMPSKASNAKIWRAGQTRKATSQTMMPRQRPHPTLTAPSTEGTRSMRECTP